MNNKQQNFRDEVKAIAERAMQVTLETMTLNKIIDDIEIRYAFLGIPRDEQERIFSEICQEVNPELYELTKPNG